MEVRIRDVDPYTVKKIDQWAKEKGISRQVYLKNLLDSLTTIDIHSNVIDKYEKQLEVNTLFLEKTSDTMSELLEVIKELIIDE
ncbi:hypothetical protein [Sporosarcina sp. G11-34]|uniref:hypothetical protein n=1 Tax=Sporosarcina sp. G11-34 TaxID=2849605 RepID=UPI0022A9AC1A|nr:hypothetical protein [Sporosarcina sp. G11-34]MCZ2260755.1 hypothetical protein [Sporosarcina sp. G11-34]